MTLSDAIRSLGAMQAEQIVCARPPWAPDSECVVVEPDERLAVPESVKRMGFRYFLEVGVAREVLEDVAQKSLSEDDKVRLLIFYAENDAFPEWIERV